MTVILRGLAWLRDSIANQAERFFLRVLAAGPVPRHVAFVMDGNRRYARKQQKQVQEGHVDGYVALRRMLEVCLRLNVQCVSAYAFSIENFKRSEDEVEALMKLAEEKLLELCEHGDILDEYGVRLNVLGRTSLLPEKVQLAVQKAEYMTRHNTRAILNLCMPYTSRDEITTAVESCVRNADPSNPIPATFAGPDRVPDHGSRCPSKTFSRQLYLHDRHPTPPLDILVRTSGVKRLSDFLLWQCCEDTQIQISSTFWPDFGLLDFVPIILDFQRKAWGRRISL
ncbi:uncharacterized protein LACBIDRAFT_236401 [Laccaria bicolor S238N-H82]|uniref:Alkyl transferase n=1 Tax=Laccaria bicolor (strain S238N-H82 / ATCC MYA-4686) TaxID=486041 RepID=B0DFU7_LACBS|nr:uncharacterized protein LACBIDRAFT_236401 [Laccaria bicolor S238N-H82]EDR06524.1 predicted protein [Laccaria bicolor S238N-H82]|eukprot:XP_001882896.1 predicted protein [Laccaria bicolor S238N-H82]